MKVVTYNIDGLPEKLDLNDLPWILKPIAWIYKLIKGTTLITINDGINHNKEISEYLKGADIIGVQEDFNHHNELLSSLKEYNTGTHKEEFSLSKIFSNIKLFPYLRFKSDGINIFTNWRINKEKIIHWEKSYGYFSNANDKLTSKGFRYYNISKGGIYIDVYIVHMDADFYDGNYSKIKGDVEAKKSQLIQLSNYILNNHSTNPIIIMGDTNSYYKYKWDYDNIQEYLIKFIRNQSELQICEALPSNYSDCDRIFYINNVNSKNKLILEDCYFDSNISLSDHKPLIAIFNIISNYPKKLGLQ